MNPDVSVVIASHRPSRIGVCLDALAKHAAREVACEVIVVADYAIEKKIQQYPSPQWLFIDEIGIPVKRNAGIRAAGAPLVAFIDDDCVACEGWLDAGVKYLSDHPELQAVEGQTLIEQAKAGSSTPRAEYRRLEKPGYRTNNIFYRKSAIDEIGGFDERFTVQREDLDLAFGIMTNGGKIGFDETIKVMHAARRDEPWDLLKNCVHRRFDPLLYKKYPSLYRDHVGTPVPPGILGLAILHLLVLLCCAGPLLLGQIAIICDIVVCFLLAARRQGFRSINSGQWIIDACSYAIAPPALVGALLWGSAKFGKLLLV